MLDLWSETGPLAYLILPAGALALLCAVAYVRNGRPDTFALAAGSAVTTALLGVLAFVTGAHRALGGLPHLDADDRWIAILGVAESLSCFILSLVLAVTVSVLLTLGSWRTRRELQTAAEPVAA